MEENQAQQEEQNAPQSPEEEPLPGDTPVAEEDFADAEAAASSDEMDDAENDGADQSDAANLAQPAPAQTPHQNLPPEQLPAAEEQDPAPYRPPHEQEMARQAQEQEQSQQSGLEAPRPDQDDAANPL